jgi:[ribosomal protein S18]-alanine N-acetyltransferase
MADLDALFAIDQECFRPGIAYSRVELRYYLSRPRAVSFVAEDDANGAIAGFAVAEIYLQKGAPVGHIITIDVRSSSRKKGIGRLLMDAIQAQLHEAGASVVRLEVAADNEGAQAFYRRFGFAQTGRIPGYYMGKLDAFLMEKRLDD